MFLYAYTHVDPRDGAVRYVGVGPKSRGFDFKTRSYPHLAWIAELNGLDLEPTVEFHNRTRSRLEVLTAERDLIALHLEKGALLFNKSVDDTCYAAAHTLRDNAPRIYNRFRSVLA